MHEGPTAEEIELLLSTPEGQKALKKIQFNSDIPDSIDEVGYDPKVFSDTFDTIDEVGYDPDVDQIDIGASPDNPGATRGLPQDFSPYQDPQILDQDPEMPPPGTQAMDPNMTFEEMERRKMLAQLMANQQTRTA